jgi:hypothetical protein
VTRATRTKDENGFPVWRDNEHRENFFALAHKAMLYSNWAAPGSDLPGHCRGLSAQRRLRARTAASQRRRHPGGRDPGDEYRRIGGEAGLDSRLAKICDKKSEFVLGSVDGKGPRRHLIFG